MTDWPTIDTIHTGPEGDVRITGHYWIGTPDEGDERWIEICWVDERHTHRRELVAHTDFHQRFPTTIHPD